MEKKRSAVLRYYVTALAAIIMAFVLPLHTIGGLIAFFVILAAAFIGGSFIPVPAIEAARAPTGNRDIDGVISEGFAAIGRMRQVNGRIPGAAISGRIDKLEGLTRDIFAFLKQHPEQLRMVRTFMDYTLPTALKLLDTYAELSAKPNKGDNITDTIAHIDTALDGVVKSFEGTLDKLYSDRALDIQTDIDVLKGMIAREGLDNPFQAQMDNNK